MRRVLVAALLLLAVPAVEARTESGTAIVTRSAPHEVDLVLDANGALAWRWSTDGDAELVFDVHTHDASGNVHTVRRAGPAVAHEGRVPVGAGTYSVYWTHPGSGPAQVALTYTIEGPFRFAHEARAPEPDAPRETPGSVAWAALAASAALLLRRRA